MHLVRIYPYKNRTKCLRSNSSVWNCLPLKSYIFIGFFGSAHEVSVCVFWGFNLWSEHSIQRQHVTAPSPGQLIKRARQQRRRYKVTAVTQTERSYFLLKIFCWHAVISIYLPTFLLQQCYRNVYILQLFHSADCRDYF